MNRMEEYAALLQELETPPEKLETTVERAMNRKNALQRKRRAVWGSVGSFAACFAAFVLSVNCFPTFAKACESIPVLSALAEAVRFSPSLSAAVEHDYVQPMNLSQTENGVTATVEYLIVDQKQVNIFYTLKGDFDRIWAEKVTLQPKDNHVMSYDGFQNPPGSLQDITVDYLEEDVPESLRLTLAVAAENGAEEWEAPQQIFEDELLRPVVRQKPEILAEFTFDLHFDPSFTAAGEVIPVHETVTLAGQSITVAEAEIYPTHVRINVADDPANTAWLKGLHFYLENERGERFEPISNGISATGSDTPTMVSYRLESPYFGESRHLTLHITGSEWLDKDHEWLEIDLARAQAERLPEGVELLETVHRPGGWVVTFLAERRKETASYQIFYTTFRDGKGNEYDSNGRSSTVYDGDAMKFEESLPLPDYHDNTVWLRPTFSRVTTEDVVIPIK